MKRKERRYLRAQVRAAKKDGGGEAHINGYAAVYDDAYEYNLFGIEVREQIVPGAFSRALREKQDVRCLFNHDSNYILGRTKAGTLVLSEDKTGLLYECEPPTNVMAAGVVESIQRGDVDGSSFGFTVRKQEWDEEKDKEGNLVKITRRILEIDTLYDVSPVTFPAYEGTSVEARTAEMFPDGVPEEFREHGVVERTAHMCECDCPECEDDDCDNCSDVNCVDPNCEGSYANGHVKAKQVAATKKQEEEAAAAAAQAEADKAATAAAVAVTELERQRLQDRMTVIRASFD
jgi:HK97 family phage prohead protease